jgi:membrane-associated phospholipid phosphatase
MALLLRGRRGPATLWVAAFAVAVVLSVLAARDPALPGDVRLAQETQSWPIPNALADVIRAITMTQVVVGAGVALSGALWLAGSRRAGVALLAAIAALPLLQHGLKELIDRPRPSPELVELRAGFSSPSFPAGHVMSPTLLYGYAAWLVRRARPLWLRACLVLPCAAVLGLTGVVNVYLGVHWPSDAAGGYLWGFVLLVPAAAAAGSPGLEVRRFGAAPRRTP